MLQLTAKNAYLASWYNRAVSGVENYAEDLNLDEVVKLYTMEKCIAFVEYFSRSNQALDSLKQQQTSMQSYLVNK